MKNAVEYYNVGALLYCPANNESVANSIITEKFTNPYSLGLCLEDSIRDDCVLEAEEALIITIKTVLEAREKKKFYLPKIFIRVRSSEQMISLTCRLNQYMEIITGFIVPKFSLENADSYINAITYINNTLAKRVYMIPIYESSSIIDLRTRYDILYALKEKLDKIEELVLNIHVGGNDLCHMFGFRRHSDESIHKISPVANIFSDIITVYGMDYVIAGPIWEYFDGFNWDSGLEKEIADDRICGFIGKTIIHPKHISFVNDAYKVLPKDLEDAKKILNWNKDTNMLVSSSAGCERMNEYKTHINWAHQIILLAEAFGTKESVN